MLTRNTLLGDDQVRLESDDGIAHGLDLLLLDLQYPVPVLLLADFDVGLGLALLVLERAVEQNDPGLLDAPPHLGVGDVLVEHDTVQNLAILDFSTGYFLHSGVPLDINLPLAASDLKRNRPHRLQGKVAHQLRPPRDELGADRGGDQGVHSLVIVDVDGYRDFFDDGDGIRKGALESGYYGDRVDVALELGQGLSQHLARCTTCQSQLRSLAGVGRTKNDDAGGTVADLLVLCSAELDHALRGRVSDLNLSQDSVAVVGQDNTAHGVEQHLEHGLGAQT